MKEIETGIYPTYIPENDVELSRHYDLGGVEKPAVIIARYEQRAIAVLMRHKIVDETFLCDQSPIEPPARKFVVDQHPAIIRRQLVQKREDETYEPAKGPAVYRVANPASLAVPLDSPPELFDARSLLMQIEIYRHSEQSLSRGLRELAYFDPLAAPGGSPDSAVRVPVQLSQNANENEFFDENTPEQRKANLLDDVRHKTEILNAHAMKIGELADRLFKGRPSEERVRFANGVRAGYANSGKLSSEARAASRKELDEAILGVMKSIIDYYKTETTNHIAVRVRTRLEQSDEIKDILSRMDSKIPSKIPAHSTLRKKINALRPK